MTKIWQLGSLAVGLLVFGYVFVNQADNEQEMAELGDTKVVIDDQKRSEPTAPQQNMAISTLPNTNKQDAALDVQLEDALMLYSEYSKYPPNSQPILNEAHINAFMNAGLPQSSLPFPFDDLETPIQARIELNQHNYFYGDAIVAKVDVNQVPEQASVNIRAVLMNLEGDILAESSKQEYQDNRSLITFETQHYSANSWPIELNVGAYIDVNGRNLFISAPFKINDQTASLESLGFSEPVAENLLIPLNLNVEMAGYYYVAAVLYSSNSQQPLVHLETEGQLPEGSANLYLKAHIQALKKAADEGPYYLDNIRIERWSDELIPRDISGKVDDTEYLVDGYAFTHYEDKPYLDPLSKERERLIQGLSAQ